MYCFNYEPDDIIDTKLLTYKIEYVNDDIDNIKVSEVIKTYLKHPEASDNAKIPIITYGSIKTFNRFSNNEKYNKALLAYTSINNLKSLFK